MNGTAVEILLVEDNPADAEVTIRALRKHNLANNLLWAKDGAAALDALFGNDMAPPRLVLLDLKLPKVDGLEVLQRIRAEPRTRATPVVVLTSSTQDQDIIQSYELGVNSYVAKPVKFESFADVVSRLGLYWLLINTPPDGKRPG